MLLTVILSVAEGSVLLESAASFWRSFGYAQDDMEGFFDAG